MCLTAGSSPDKTEAVPNTMENTFFEEGIFFFFKIRTTFATKIQNYITEVLEAD